PRVRAMSIAARGVRGGRRLAKLVDDLPQVLNAILLAALLAQIGSATVVGILSSRWFGSLGVTLASVALTLVLFVYGEALPKTYAVRHPDRVALRLARPIATLELMLRPAVSALVWIADLQMPGKGITSPTVTEDELRLLASRAAEEGEISDADQVLIERAFRFGDRRADDVMVPRPDIVAVASGATVEEAIALALEAGHRRLPVYEGDVENIIGVVGLRDLVRARSSGDQGPVEDLAAAPLVVPESKRIVELFEDMRRQQTHLAVVVDEYGGTAGLVTIEDLAEELIGVLGEHREDSEILGLGDDHWVVKASLPVEDLEELLGQRLPEGDFNTVAGLMMSLAGRVLERGDEVEVAGRRLVVVSARRHRIGEVEVMPGSQASAGGLG
ncbi:MAG TPA: hemolysin family protein, partial [Acidimicrobiia bacterium]